MFDPQVLLKIYFVFMLVGFLGLLSSLLFDGDDAGDLAEGIDGGDGFDGSPKVFSLRVIFAFLMAFGIGAGAVALGENPGTLGVQVVVGLLAGVGTAAFTWWLTKVLYKMQGASNVNSDSFVGKTGDIVIGTSPGGKAKVRVSTISGPMELLCKEANDQKLKNGDLVKVTGKMGTLLIVTKQ